MRAKNSVYHIDCFRCVACSRQLIPGDEFALRDDGLFCKADHEVVERASSKENGSEDGSPRINTNNNNNNVTKRGHKHNDDNNNNEKGIQLVGKFSLYSVTTVTWICFSTCAYKWVFPSRYYISTEVSFKGLP